MRAVVTGGAGFVGSHLIDALVARDDHVVCVERPGADRSWLSDRSVRIAECGLDDPDCLEDAFRGADVVFHLAALTHARRPEEYDLVNALGTSHVVEAASRQPRTPRIVFMSSLAALGPCRNGEMLSAASVPHPLSAYGRSKLAAEAVLHQNADRVPSVILRFSAVYGPRERAVLRLFQMARRGVAVTVGSWERDVSLVYVTDAVQALLAAATAPGAVGRTYCIAHPEPVRWSEFARAVGNAVGRTPRLVSIGPGVARLVAIAAEETSRIRGRVAMLNRDRVREVSQERWVCDPRPAMDEIGYRPVFAAWRGAAATAAWYREEGWL